MTSYVPVDATLMERFVVHRVLCTIKEAALAGTPSGQLLDQAINECLHPRGEDDA